MDETELIREIQKGNTDLFADLVMLHKNRVYGALMGILRNTADAEDLTQEVFLKAFRTLPRFQFRSAFYTWIYRIAVNTAIDFKRKHGKRVMLGIDEEKGGLDVLMQEALEPPVVPPEPGSREIMSLVREAIQELEPLHRAILQMREIEGQSYREIAEQLNINQGTVMSRLFYARRKLREKLSEMDIE